MKETYVAPDLEFESFTVSTSVAGGCSPDTFSMAEGWHEAGYFAEHTQYAGTCEEEWDDSIHEGYCVWSGAEKFFTS